jgi:hypothetical protein
MRMTASLGISLATGPGVGRGVAARSRSLVLFHIIAEGHCWIAMDNIKRHPRQVTWW